MFEDILKNAAQGATPAQASEDDMFSNEKVGIAVIGVGGAGCNTINRLEKSGIKSAKTIAVNTDSLHLKMIEANTKVLIGKTITKGLGAGGFPEMGAKCAECNREELRQIISGNQLVFVTAGMGGGTGTGAAPIIASIARDEGATVVSIVTYPFKLERARLQKARWGLEQLVQNSDTVVVIDNNRLAAYAPNLPINDAFALADQITTHAVRGIADTIMFPSLMNIDFADVKSVMEGGGVALISIGEGHGADRVGQAAQATLNNPLLDVNYEGAKGALIHIGGGTSLTLGDAVELGEKITASFDDNANVKFGARITPDIGDGLMATAIITGLTSSQIFGQVKDDKEDMKARAVLEVGQLNVF